MLSQVWAEPQCGGLNEKDPSRLRHLNSWSPVGGSV